MFIINDMNTKFLLFLCLFVFYKLSGSKKLINIISNLGFTSLFLQQRLWDTSSIVWLQTFSTGTIKFSLLLLYRNVTQWMSFTVFGIQCYSGISWTSVDDLHFSFFSIVLQFTTELSCNKLQNVLHCPPMSCNVIKKILWPPCSTQFVHSRNFWHNRCLRHWRTYVPIILLCEHKLIL